MSAMPKLTRFLFLEVSRVCLGLVFYLCSELSLALSRFPPHVLRAVPTTASLDAFKTEKNMTGMLRLDLCVHAAWISMVI